MRSAFAFLFICISLITQAQQSVRMNEGWQFLRQDLGGVWEAVRPVKAGNPEDVPLWQNVSLPHCYNARDAVDPDVNYYQGPGWYRKDLEANNPYPNGRTYLHFEGAGQKTEVYLYTNKIASHVGGYDEFWVDITDALAAYKGSDFYQKDSLKRVPLSIRVDNSRDLEMMPSDLSDFNLYGGIYRYLNLVYTPEVNIRSLHLLPETDSLGKKARLLVSGLFNTHTSGSLQVLLKDPAGKLVAERKISLSSQNSFSIPFDISKPVLWSPSHPSLYQVEANLVTNNGTFRQQEQCGFRHFEFVKKGPFRLNGKRLLLRGTHRHEDHAGIAAAMTEDLMRKEMVMMKDMGVNFIRLGHYQQSRIILNLCDSLGILVWEEIPWCRGGLGGEVYREQGRRMLTNMIDQHYNHPSVIIWGLGNENDWPGDFPQFEKDSIRMFMKQLNDLSHQKDPSRMTAIRRCDFCSDIVDVYSPSIWAGWYRGVYTEYRDVSKAEFDKVDRFLHVEWGGDSHAGRHSENPDKALQAIKRAGAADERAGDASLFGGAARVSKDGDWSESYICNLIDWHLKEQELMPWLSGTAQWPFKDFSTPVRPDNSIPYMNQKGVVERDLTKKEAFYVFQSYWTSKPMVHIYGHTMPVRWGAEGEEKMIKVYSNCTEAELFVNGVSKGIKKRNSQDFPAAGLRWNIPMKQGSYQVRVVAKIGKTMVEDQISFDYESRSWSKPAKLLIEKVKEDNETVTIQAKLLDVNNVQCLDAANWIRFGLTGDGELLDDLGTSSGSRLVQLYNGRAFISVSKKNGQSVLSARVEGIATSFINL